MQTPPQAPSGRPGPPGGTPPGPGPVPRRGVARPLPDPVATLGPDLGSRSVAIRICAVPEVAPPYDDEAPSGSPPAGAGELALRIIAGLSATDSPPGPARPQDAATMTRPQDAAIVGRPLGAATVGRPQDAAIVGRPLGAATVGRPQDAAGRPGTGAGDQRDAARHQATANPRRAGGTRPADSGDTAEDRRERTRRQAARRERQARPGGLSPGGQRGPGAQQDAWPSRFAQVLAETLAGSRPPAQLSPWTTERARTHIRRLGPLLTAGQRPRVHRVITSLPASGVIEMSVVVGFGPRVRALAIRLEQTEPRSTSPGQPPSQPRWLCTAVEAA